jgi:hypothetical protein
MSFEPSHLCKISMKNDNLSKFIQI